MGLKALTELRSYSRLLTMSSFKAIGAGRVALSASQFTKLQTMSSVFKVSKFIGSSRLAMNAAKVASALSKASAAFNLLGVIYDTRSLSRCIQDLVNRTESEAAAELN